MAGNRVISAVLTLRDRNFGRTAADAANRTRDLERRVKSTGNAVSRFGRSATSSFKSVAKSALGLAAAYVGVNAIKDLGVSMIESAAAAQAMSSQFDQVFSGMESAAEKSLAKVAGETGVLSGRLKGSFLGMAAFAKTTGMDTAGALELTERATLAAADGAAFYDKSIESMSESLQSFLKGNFANDAALGISATETTRNATANKLYGKSFKKLAEDQKQLTLLSMVEDGNKLSGALGQAARETDGLENVLGNLKQSWKQVKEKLGEPILEPVIKGMQRLTDRIGNVNTDVIVSGFSKFGAVVKGTFNTIKPGLNWMKDTALPAIKDGIVNMYIASQPGLNWMKDTAFPALKDGIGLAVDKAIEMYNFFVDNWPLISPIIVGVAASVAAFKIGVVAISTATAVWKGVTTAATIAVGLLNGTLALSPFGWVVLAIGAVVAAGIALYQNWDTVKAGAQSLWDKTKEVWMGIEIGFSNAWNVVKTAAGESLNFIIEKINTMIGVINKIPGVNIPIVAKVEWGQAVQPANANKAIKGSLASYDVGTNRVERDQVAKIHRDEMIVPAVQSRNLRKQGVTIDNIDKASTARPFMTRTVSASPSPSPSSKSTGNTGNDSLLLQVLQAIKNMPKGDVNVTINGTNLTVAEIVNELVPLLKLRYANL